MIKIRTFCSEEQRRIFITMDVIQRELHNSSPRTRVTPGGQTPNLFLFPLALFVHIAYVSSLMCSSCVLLSFISSWLLPLLLLIVFYLIWSICSLNLLYVFCCLTCLLLCLSFLFFSLPLCLPLRLDCLCLFRLCIDKDIPRYMWHKALYAQSPLCSFPVLIVTVDMLCSEPILKW